MDIMGIFLDFLDNGIFKGLLGNFGIFWDISLFTSHLSLDLSYQYLFYLSPDEAEDNEKEGRVVSGTDQGKEKTTKQR